VPYLHQTPPTYLHFRAATAAVTKALASTAPRTLRKQKKRKFKQQAGGVEREDKP
jgi:hypothetical protein